MHLVDAGVRPVNSRVGLVEAGVQLIEALGHPPLDGVEPGLHAVEPLGHPPDLLQLREQRPANRLSDALRQSPHAGAGHVCLSATVEAA